MHHNQNDTTRSEIEVRRYEEFSTAPNISLSFYSPDRGLCGIHCPCGIIIFIGNTILIHYHTKIGGISITFSILLKVNPPLLSHLP